MAGGPGMPGMFGASNDPKSPQYPVQELVKKILADDFEGLDAFIDSRARGLAAKLRDGKASDKEKSELKEALTEAKQTSNKPKGTEFTFIYEAEGAKQRVVFVVAGRQDAEKKIREIHIRQTR